MTDDPGAMIHGYLDGVLDEAGVSALNDWLAADPANARAFAAAALLHDRLHDLAAAGVPAAPASRPGPEKPLRWRRAAAAGSLMAAAVVLAVWVSVPGRVSAAAELDRLIQAPAPVGDRTYRVTARDPGPDPGDDRQPPIDGALLHVRNPDRYVLERRTPDGRPVVTGSDGERGWSVRPDGAVRVSGDPLRFRGPLPGNQHGIPFLDPRSDLRHLRDAYAVTALPPAGGLRGLALEKRSPEHRGPRRVEVWYDPQTRVVRRMEFDGLPRARGGPTAVSVELVGQRDLGPGFFSHEAHHGPGRKVVEEE